MAEDWQSISEEVAAALLEAGATGLLMPPPSPSTGPLAGKRTPPEPEQCVVVFDEFTLAERATSNIADNEVKLLIGAAGLSSPPTTSHTVKVNGKEYSILQVMATQPGGTPVLYEVRAK